MLAKSIYKADLLCAYQQNLLLSTEISTTLAITSNLSTTKMGRRKKAAKPPPKRKTIEKLDVTFNCPFCNHEKSCEVKMDRKTKTALISCTVCLEDYQAKIHYLSEAIDVYNEWIDACEAANE